MSQIEIIGARNDSGDVIVVPIDTNFEIKDVSKEASSRISQSFRVACKTCELNGDICRRTGGVTKEGIILETYKESPIKHQECKVVCMPLTTLSDGIKVELKQPK